MSAVAAPFGIRCVYHPSGEPRIETIVGGIVSGYGTSIFTNTPVKLDTNGTLIPCTTGADVVLGTFAGCFFISGGIPRISPYWPAGQTYDANTYMWAQYNAIDPLAIYEGQADGSIPQTELGESINLANTSQGSVFTGLSSQALTATTTGASAGTFIIQNIAPYPDNAWGDAFTIVRVRVGTVQGPIA